MSNPSRDRTAVIAMPFNRLFPTDKRHKMTFDNYPPVYVYIDTLGGWNVDTRYLAPELRTWLETSFETLFNQQFPELYPHHIVRAQREFYDMLLLHVVMIVDAGAPTIVLTYYDKQLFYAVPGRLSKGQLTNCDSILDDFIGGSMSPSSQ